VELVEYIRSTESTEPNEDYYFQLSEKSKELFLDDFDYYLKLCDSSKLSPINFENQRGNEVREEVHVSNLVDTGNEVTDKLNELIDEIVRRVTKSEAVAPEPQAQIHQEMETTEIGNQPKLSIEIIDGVVNVAIDTSPDLTEDKMKSAEILNSEELHEPLQSTNKVHHATQIAVTARERNVMENKLAIDGCYIASEINTDMSAPITKPFAFSETKALNSNEAQNSDSEGYWVTESFSLMGWVDTEVEDQLEAERGISYLFSHK
jgi:hypothetical protein